MFRIDDPTAVGSLPAPGAPGTEGYFADGTKVTHDWANMIQGEIENVVLGAGLTPSKTDHTQLGAAIADLIATAVSGISPTVAAAQFQNQQAAGVASGEAIPSATWTQRVLNHTVFNSIAGASRASNQIALPPGDYVLNGSAGYWQVAGGTNATVKTRLRNITAGTTLLVGVGQPTVNFTQVATPIAGAFTLAVSSVLELETWSGSTAAGSGGEVSTAPTEVEVYVDATFTKIA